MTIEARTRREFLRTVSMAAVAAGASGRCQMSRNDSYSFQQFQTNGISVRAVVEGTGPLVIMVHGFPELWYSWRHQIQPIAEAGFKVVAPDVRGYGRSDKPHPIEAYDMVSLTNDVVGLIDALGEDQAILFGHDWAPPSAGTRLRSIRSGSRPSLDWAYRFSNAGRSLRSTTGKRSMETGSFTSSIFKRKAWRRPRSKPISAPRFGRSTRRFRVTVKTRPSTASRPRSPSKICSQRWWTRTLFQRG